MNNQNKGSQLLVHAGTWLLRAFAKKFFSWLLVLLGPYLLLLLLIVVILLGVFGGMSSGDFNTDGMSGGSQDAVVLRLYQEAANGVNPPINDEEGEGVSDSYRLDWGILYAIDVLAEGSRSDTGIDAKRLQDMAQALAPKYRYRQAEIVETVTTGPNQGQTTSIPIRLLESVDTYSGTYTFTYEQKTYTYMAGEDVIKRTEPQLIGSSQRQDFSRLDEVLRTFAGKREIEDIDRTMVLQMAVGVNQQRENLSWLLGKTGWNQEAGAYTGEVPAHFLEFFKAAGEKYGVKPSILMAIAKIESSFRPDAVGPLAGDGQRAQGLMQFKPTTWETFGVDGNGDGKANPFDPVDAIFSAANYLHYLTGVFDGDFRKAVKNYGEGTEEYATKVFTLAEGFLVSPVDAHNGYVWPVQGTGFAQITQRFGEVSDTSPSGHGGMDIGAPAGTPIFAVVQGTITRVGQSVRGGNEIILRGQDGNQWYFAHLQKFAVTNGEEVKAGQIIGYVGSTGRSTGPHLHLELWINGRKSDPLRVYQQ